MKKRSEFEKARDKAWELREEHGKEMLFRDGANWAHEWLKEREPVLAHSNGFDFLMVKDHEKYEALQKEADALAKALEDYDRDLHKEYEGGQYRKCDALKRYEAFKNEE